MSNKRSQRIRSNRLGRNDPCPCGSGRKYKKCHGELAQGRQSPGNITEALEAHKAKESLRKHQQGKGKPIISTEFAGQRVVAVGGTAYFAKNQRTFVDFLGDYIKRALGSDWGTAEIKKPLEDRHQILQWYDALCAYQRKHASRPEGDIQESPMTGLVSAYYGLAYNLYLLQHNAELQAYLMRRIKHGNSFYAAYYETFVAAWFILAGFELAIENEQDSTRTHAEFIATKGGRSYSVEAKTRTPQKPNYDVGNQLYKALKIDAEHPRFVFIDTNIGRDIDLERFGAEVTSALTGRESKLTISGDPAPPAYVFVTNQPYHLQLDDELVPRVLLTIGFKISDYGQGVQFASLIDAHRAREKHADALAIGEAFQQYKIPTTFDGEIPEFAFGEAERRFIIGQRYEISEGIFATLTTALVVEEERRAHLFFHTDDDQCPTLTAELSDTEMSAYKAHPETFFGRVLKQGGNIEGPMDLFYFFLDGYKETSKAHLLELMKVADDFEDLKTLPVEKLRLIYAERLTYSAMAQK